MASPAYSTAAASCSRRDWTASRADTRSSNWRARVPISSVRSRPGAGPRFPPWRRASRWPVSRPSGAETMPRIRPASMSMVIAAVTSRPSSSVRTVSRPVARIVRGIRVSSMKAGLPARSRNSLKSDMSSCRVTRREPSPRLTSPRASACISGRHPVAATAVGNHGGREHAELGEQALRIQIAAHDQCPGRPAGAISPRNVPQRQDQGALRGVHQPGDRSPAARRRQQRWPGRLRHCTWWCPASEQGGKFSAGTAP